MIFMSPPVATFDRFHDRGETTRGNGPSFGKVLAKNLHWHGGRRGMPQMVWIG